ncbi:MAG: Ig-like domain-containing protein [Clostridia bacterium]|nr:Ig-like domain-containing protein [Clostridia bacterium]
MWVYFSGDNLKNIYGYILVDNLEPEIALDSITLPKTKEIQLGKTLKLTPTFSPSNTTNKIVTWTSSDETVATVDNAGNITPKKIGSTIITVASEDGKKKATCTVTVTQTTSNASNSSSSNDSNNSNNSSSSGNSNNQTNSNASSNANSSNNANSNNQENSLNGSSSNNKINSEQSSSSNQASNQTSKDNTVASSKLPNTGAKAGIVLIIGLLITASFFAYHKYNKLKGI